MNRFFQRSLISPVVTLSFVITVLTGLMMFFHIRVHAINNLHEFGGIVFAIAGIIHLLINWKAFLSCFKKPHGIAAVILCSLLCLGLVFGTKDQVPQPKHDFSYGGLGSE